MVQNAAKGIIQQLQSIATEMVGLEALWFRNVPEKDSEDIILQEYTLSHVECPREIKVITSQSDYNPGAFVATLFSVDYEANMEINVPIEDWRNIYGSDTMPQQNDIVYIKIWHKIYEVKSSCVVYQAGSIPMYYKISLGKYVPNRATAMPEHIAESFDEMMVSQEELFGEKISEEVGDTTAPRETNYNTHTYVDPEKDFDIDSITNDKFIALDGNIVGYAYYDMAKAEQPVTYYVSTQYSPDNERNHFIYTCWFRINETESKEEKPCRVFSLYQKDKQFAYFRISTQLRLAEGDTVTVSRGRLISVTGEIVRLDCENMFFVKVPIGQVNQMNKKLTNWYESGSFRVSKNSTVTLLKSLDDNFFVKTNVQENNVSVRFGNIKKTFKSKKDIDFTKWIYLAIDFTSNYVEIVMQQLDRDGLGELYMKPLIEETSKAAIPANDFEIDTLQIDAAETGLNIRNIRIYLNEYPMEETYKIDMFTSVARNESKMLLADGPRNPDTGMFYSPVR